MNIIKKESVGTAIPETGSIEINQEQNTIPEELLKEFISIRERFLPLWSATGLISLEGSSGIHLEDEQFLATFPEHEVITRDDEKYPEELFTIFEGVRFFCIK